MGEGATGGEDEVGGGRAASLTGEGCFDDDAEDSAGACKLFPSRRDDGAFGASESAIDARKAPPFEAALRGGEAGGRCCENGPE